MTRTVALYSPMPGASSPVERYSVLFTVIAIAPLWTHTWVGILWPPLTVVSEPLGLTTFQYEESRPGAMAVSTFAIEEESLISALFPVSVYVLDVYSGKE